MTPKLRRGGTTRARRWTAVLVTTALMLGLGQTLVLGNVRTEPPAGGIRNDLASAGVSVAHSPDISADGRAIAFVGHGAGIFVRDLADGHLEHVASSTDGGSVSSPSLSGDGRLVAYVETRAGGSAVMVADRADPVHMTLRQATGRSGDLFFQRALPCSVGTPPSGAADVAAAARRCRPTLSSDGRTLVFPARLAVPSPALAFSTAGPEAQAHLLDGDISLGSGGGRPTTVEAPVLIAAGTTGTLHVTVKGIEPLAFAPPSVGPGGEFAVVPSATTCGADPTTLIPPGSSCTIAISFNPLGRDCASSPVRFSHLLVNGPTAAARSAVALVGVDAGPGCAGGVRSTPPTGCVPAPRPQGTAAALKTRPSGPASTVVAGEVGVGDSKLLAVPLRAADRPQVVSFATSGCDVALVTPRRVPAGRACRPGMTLLPPLVDLDATVRDLVRATVTIPPGGKGCTAYLRIAPTSVNPFAAALLTTPVGGGETRVVPIGGTGSLDVIIARRDLSGSGDFARPGTTAEVVSVDGAGVRVPAAEPTVSGDGRYVAFISPAHGAGRQVLLHDTVADGSGRPGPTSVVSALPDGARPAWAASPALSDDGQSVAFAARPAVPGRHAATACCTQIFVRDVNSGSTYGVVDEATSRQHAASPALSGDGSTLAFSAGSTANGSADVLYLRDLGPDRGGPGERRNEQITVDVARLGASSPTLDAHGGHLAWQVGESDPGPAASRVLVQTRYGTGIVTPGAVEFGPQEVGSTSSPKSIVVRNGGPGPLTVTPSVNGPLKLNDGCAARVLHRAESCVLDASFSPEELGASRATLSVTSRSADLVQSSEIAVGGNAIPPVLQILPRKIKMPRSSLGATGQPALVEIRNTGRQPVSISAASSSAEFAVRRGCVGQLRAGGEPCRLLLVFQPQDLGRRTATLAVSWTPAAEGATPLTQMVPMEAETLTPEMAFSPTVVVAGRVSMLVGRHLPPETYVRVEDTAGRFGAVGRTDATGRLRLPVVVLATQPAGPLRLRVRVGATLVLQPAPVLVVPGTFQPPDFSRRA